MTHVIVIGGGAAGCMAALAAAQRGASVTLLERNPKLGRKLYITGKGRCNVTNDSPAAEVLQNIPHNSRFLTSAVTRFPPEAVKAFFEGLGVPLKTERGNRVFPQSDRAADIIDALLRALRRAGVSIVQDRAVSLRREDGALLGVEGEGGFYPGGAAVIATVYALIVGMFMDLTPALLIFTPIFLPIATAIGMHPVHFGIMIMFNLCVGIMTPPVGSALFVGCSISGVSIESATRKLLPFFAAIIIVLMFVTYVPALSMTIPTWAGMI